MTVRALPNPNNLTVTVGTRTYTGQVDTPVAVQEADVPALRTAGWTILAPLVPGSITRDDGGFIGLMDATGKLVRVGVLPTDLVANLITVVGTPNSLAEATDIPAIVRYDSKGVGTAFYATGQIGTICTFNDTVPSLASATPTQMPIAVKSIDTAKLVQSDGTFTVPSAFNGPIYVTAMGSVSFGANSAGTARSIALQYYDPNSTSWVGSSVSVAPTASAVVLPFNLLTATVGNQNLASYQFRLAVTQDSGTSLFCALNNTIIQVFRAF